MFPTRHELETAKLVCIVVGAIFAAVAASVALVNTVQTSAQQETTRQLYRRALSILRTEPWHDLSGAVIESFFKVGRLAASLPNTLYGKRVASVALVALVPAAFLGSVLMGRDSSALSMILLIDVMGAGLLIAARIAPARDPRRGPALMGCTAMLLISSTFGFFDWTRLMVVKTMTMALAISVFAIPLLWLPLVLISTGEILDVLAGQKLFEPFYWKREGAFDVLFEPRKPRLISPGQHRESRSAGLALYVSSSLFLSLGAMALGKALDATELVPRTRQMLVANVICDALTLMATSHFLQISSNTRRRFGVLAALISNLLIAAILAVVSLWFGTLGTATHLTWPENFRVLLGWLPDGSRRSFGALFWTMHTTFIPVAACLLVVLLAYFARILLRPAEWIVGKGAQVEKPVQLTSVLFTLGASTMGAASAAVQLALFYLP